MNLKKTLAGLSAGIVAVSALATVAASAQEAKTTPFDTFGVEYYVETTINAKGTSGATGSGDKGLRVYVGTMLQADSKDDVKIKSVSVGGNAVAADDVDATTSKSTTMVTVNGLGSGEGKINSVTFTTKQKVDTKDKAKDLAKAINDNKSVITDAAAPIYGIALQNSVPAMYPSDGFSGSIDAKATSEKYYLQLDSKETCTNQGDIDAFKAIQNKMTTALGTTTSVTTTDSAINAALASVALLGEGKGVTTVTGGVTPVDAEVYKDKYVTITLAVSGAGASTLAAKMNDVPKAKYNVKENSEDAFAGVDGSNWNASHSFKTPKLGNIDTAIANALRDNRGAMLVFYFQDKKDAETDGLLSAPGYGQDTAWSDGKTEDFAIRINGTKELKGIGTVDADALTISFSWDECLRNSNLGNATGQITSIEYKANKDGFLYDSAYDDDKNEATFRYEITKIVVVVPENDDVVADDLSWAAGEAETIVEATPAVDGAPAADTTAAAANPTTGNSAVALVAIPVAIAAAAFVAKKRG